MYFFKRAAVFFAILFATTQLLIPHVTPASSVYNERMTYDVVKNSSYDIEAVLSSIKETIRKEHLKDYIIILGDSVGYGIPCPPDKNISAYMNNIFKSKASSFRVFNLSIPSMTFGDAYAMIKLLESRGISTQNIIVDNCYWGFFSKNPAFWYGTYLRKLDPEAYVETATEKQKENESLRSTLISKARYALYTNLSILEYRDYIVYSLRKKSDALFGDNTAALKPWYEKNKELTKKNINENKWAFTDKPFIMDESNIQIYFLNKILENQKDKNILFFLPALNDKLLGEYTENPGFKDNVEKVHKYFESKNAKFIDYSGQIDYNLFSDHVHLLPEGYKLMAEDLSKRILSIER